MPGTEAERLRIVDQGRIDDATRGLPEPAAGAPSVLAVTTTISTYPTSAAAFYGCVAQAVFGSETEGGSPTLTAAETFLALNLGSAVPSPDTPVICTFVDNRWVFRYDLDFPDCLVSAKENPSTSLNIKVAAGNWADSGDATITNYAGTGSYTLGASTTTFVYLDSGGTLASSTSSFPATSTHLATVITGASTVTSVQDNRTVFTAAQQSP